jgi:hypothetical protein
MVVSLAELSVAHLARTKAVLKGEKMADLKGSKMGE